jgi:hypothetical protein
MGNNGDFVVEGEVKTAIASYANGDMILFKDFKIGPGCKVEFTKAYHQPELDRILHRDFTNKWETAKMTFDEIMISLKFMDNVIVRAAKVDVRFLTSWGSLYGYMIRFNGVLMDHDKLRTLPGPLIVTPTTVNGFPINNFAVGTEILALDGQEISVGDKLFRIEGENLITVKDGNKYHQSCSIIYRLNGDLFTYKDGYLSVGKHMVKLVFPEVTTAAISFKVCE